MSMCSLDGSVRVIVDRDRYGVTWQCPFCKGLSREEFDPRPIAPRAIGTALNREWER
jgi:hypothetical protein